MTVEQAQRIIELLEHQLALLEVMAVALVPEEAEPSDDCQHPDDNRVSLKTPGMPDHWICNLCKHEHRGVITN